MGLCRNKESVRREACIVRRYLRDALAISFTIRIWSTATYQRVVGHVRISASMDLSYVPFTIGNCLLFRFVTF